MLKHGSLHPDDLSALEEAIRVKLTGRTPPYATYTQHALFMSKAVVTKAVTLCVVPNKCCFLFRAIHGVVPTTAITSSLRLPMQPQYNGARAQSSLRR
jgi:hypothetical protein